MEISLVKNDFQVIDSNISGIVNYIIKYISKTDEKIVYSRHIDDCIKIELSKDDFCVGYKLSYCTKFVLFDELFKGTILDSDIKRGVYYDTSQSIVS